MNKDILERGLIGVLLLIALCQPVTAQQVADPGLDELRISLTPTTGSVVLDPQFDSEVTAYTISFSNNAENLKLDLEASTSTASIEISYDGTVIGTEIGNTITTIPLSTVQVAAIEIKVTVGQSSISYNFAVNRVNLSQCINSISDTDDDRYLGVLDIDKDGDGLIEICDLEGLDAMRYQLDGTGYQASTTATEITAGCPDSRCRGYELTRDLDFNSTASYAYEGNQRNWAKPNNSDELSDIGWFPIGTSENKDRFPFTGVFDGNGHKISNLFMKRTLDRMGLFGTLNESGVLRNIGLDVDIERGNIMQSTTPTRKELNRQGLGGLVGYVNSSATLIMNSYTEGTITFDNGFNVGGLVGRNGPLLQEAIGGKISNSYSAVNITVLGNNLPPRITRIRQIGGLVGFNKGMINNTYASGNIESRVNKVRRVGGLVGFNRGTVSNTYARGRMEGRMEGSMRVPLPADGNGVGGLVGNSNNNASTISGSYWDSTVNLIDGSLYSTSTEALQSPTEPGNTFTEVYYNWSTDNWYFGTSSQYPILGYGIGPDGIGPDEIGPDEIGPDGNDPACDNDLTDGKFTDRPPCLTMFNLDDTEGDTEIDREALSSALLSGQNFKLIEVGVDDPNNFKIHIRVFPEGLIRDN